MRRILPIALGCSLGCFLIAFPLLARGGGGGHGGGGGGHAGGGGGMHGGGGGMRSGGGAFRGGGGFRGGGFRGGGFRGNRGFRGYGRYGYGRYGYGLYGGWGYPWLYGGLYGGFDDCFSDFDDCYGSAGYGYGYPDNGGYYPSYGPSYAPGYSEPSPGVVIISNQLPPQPNIVQGPPAPTVWNAPPTTQAKKYEEPLYLLAMNDGSIHAVLAYWVDGKTVHYVTMDHMQKTAPLGSLDRGLSERLNRERNVAFSLPG
jgi:hypothetical protein